MPDLSVYPAKLTPTEFCIYLRGVLDTRDVCNGLSNTRCDNLGKVLALVDFGGNIDIEHRIQLEKQLQ